jgi:hypothetical protein
MGVFPLSIVLACLVSSSVSTYVSPSTFLDSRLSKGSWISGKDVVFANKLFEGGWIWNDSSLQVTNVCRAKTSHIFQEISIEPGELVNGTCYVSGNPEIESLSGVRQFQNYEVLMKLDDEVYEWQGFDKDTGIIPHSAVIGGIGSNYQPLLVCRRLFNGTVGNIRASKAVLGKFDPKKGKCFYEVEVDFGSQLVKWDLSFSTENFQLLILRVSTNVIIIQL